MYSYNSETGSIFITDGMIKVEPMTVEREAYVEWLSNGNVPEEVDFKTPSEMLELSTESEYAKYHSRIIDGVDAIAKFSAKMRALKIAGIIIEESHKAIDLQLEPIRNKLIAGQWIDALNYLEDIGSSNIGQSIYDEIHFELSEYIDKNY